MPEVEPVTSALLPFNMGFLVVVDWERQTLPLFLLRCNNHVINAAPRESGGGSLDLWTTDLPVTEHPWQSKSHAVFPAPGHDHDRCASDALAHAEAICAERGERLTPTRRACCRRCSPATSRSAPMS